MEAGGVDRLMNVTRQRAKYSSRVVKFASQVKNQNNAEVLRITSSDVNCLIIQTTDNSNNIF